MDPPHEKINLDDLYTRTREIQLNRIRIYQKILMRAHKKIKVTSRLRHSDYFCFYVVPEFLVGVPTYDIATCISYLVEQLTKNGFEVKYTHPNLLFISWLHYIPSYKRIEIKKRFGFKIDGFGNLIKEKKEGEETGDAAILIKNKSLVQGANKKIFKSIATYKPTGKLIYAQDLIKKINAKTS